MLLNPLVISSGFIVALGLIAAIGAQNAHVLRQGISGKRVGVTVAVCIICDSVLMSLGVYGMGELINFWPQLDVASRVGGAVFLIIFGAISFRSAFKADVLVGDGPVVTGSWSAFWAILGVTLLNPHVYLDTLVLLGGVGANYGPADRTSFALGAISASWIWFLLLGYGARVLRPVFENPKAWQFLDITIGCSMWAIALTLLL